MDMSPSALLPEIRMKDIDGNEDHYVFSGFEDTMPEIYNPNQFQDKAFKDDIDDDEFASTDQIIMAMMEDNENALPMAHRQLLECGVERVNSQISESVTAVESSLTTTTASSGFVNSNCELLPSPTNFNFTSMILEETMNGGKVDGLKSNGSDSVASKCSESNKRSRSMVRSHAQSKDHILSERKRREKLSQLFIALASMVPHLKKTDKASILVGAIEHLKQLKEKYSSLRDEVNNKKKVQTETKSSSSSSSASLMSSTNLENIDVKYEGRSILIRMNIGNVKKGDIINLLRWMEMDGLTITQSCFFPFGDSTHAITIIATMDEEFTSTANELVTKLHVLINQF